MKAGPDDPIARILSRRDLCHPHRREDRRCRQSNFHVISIALRESMKTL
jgi:hypothetical protein